ncbi:MAG: beta-lactamase family protein [Anaerovibrio sp.]|uniref:serine hydrolase domain-containing protein n=1 Tax=Anaerovibrio sp. TaxID=1872532 RepID=UPI0025FF9996|nr:serine hydrolase domain-containing protein [Anaerovibrio sp.]MCR5176916.1 beta-lactamase family protein [Anaerovibrio sp.]
MNNYEFINKEFDDIVKTGPYNVPGLGAVLIKDGVPVFRYYGGWAVLGEKPKSFTGDSLFRIASLSKQFTVYAVMQLMEAGRLHLDDNVSDYLGFPLVHPAFPDRKITVRMLANHTSGLRDGIIYCIPPKFSVREFFSPQGKFYEGGAHFSLDSEPVGEYFCYCNLNYGLLGTIIEAITGERFDRYIEKYIFKRLDIKGGYLPGNLSSEAFKNLGTLYQKKDYDGKWDEQLPWRGVMDDWHDSPPERDAVTMQNPYAVHDDTEIYDLSGYIPGNNATFFAPQGGLRVSLEDMVHTLNMLMNQGCYKGNQFISKACAEKMMKPQWIYNGHNGDTCDGTLLSYGLGLYQIKGNSTARLSQNYDLNFVGHTGQAFGLYSGMFFIPGSKDGFVYIMNGIGISEDDPKSHGKFSSNFLWEEKVTDALCNGLMNM